MVTVDGASGRLSRSPQSSECTRIERQIEALVYLAPIHGKLPDVHLHQSDHVLRDLYDPEKNI